MHIEHISHTVSGPVFKVKSGFPERFTRDNIKVHPAASIQETGICQIHIGSAYTGKISFHLFCHRSECKCSRNICRTFQIMSSGIHQKKSLRFQWNITFRCCCIMYDCSMIRIPADRIKAQIQQAFLFSAKTLQIIRCGNFRHWNFPHIFLQPIHESAHCHCIFYMGFSRIGNLCLIFDSFHLQRRIFCIYHLCRLRQIITDFCINHSAIKQNRLILQCFYILIKCLIRTRGNSILLQIFPQGIIDNFFLQEPDALFLCQCQVGKNNRYITDVISTYIQKPRNIIQRSQQMHLCTFFLHFFTDCGKLIFCTSSTVCFIQNPHRFFGHRRTIFPDLSDQILLYIKFSVFFFCDLLQFCAPSSIDNPSVKSDGPALFQRLFHIFINRRNMFLSHTVQCHSCSF